MTSIRIRPRFRHQIEGSAEEVHKKLVDGFSKNTDRIHLVKLPHYLVIEYNESIRHYWSPQLQLSLEENEEGTLLRGMYGPHPNVWAIFFYGYAAMGVLGTFFLVIGLSQIMVDEPSWAFYALGGCAVTAIVLYLIAQAGQKVGVEQTFDLHHMYTEIMGHPSPVQ